MRQVHEYAKLFPPLPPEEFSQLVADIKENGLHQPIKLHEDKVLDGVNRDRACDKAGVKPVYEKFNGGDPLAYVISQNIRRRHLTPSQRAMLGLELEKRFAAEAKARRGQPAVDKLTNAEKRSGSSSARAASVVGVGENLIRDAKRLATGTFHNRGGRVIPDKGMKASPATLNAVRAGRVTIGEALTDLRNARAHEQAIRYRHQNKMKRLQKNSRQVADFLAVCKSCSIAISVASESIERFAPEAKRFAVRKIDSLIDELSKFRKELVS
jgi:hypothetical protein